MSRGTATEHWDLVVVGAGPAGLRDRAGRTGRGPGSPRPAPRPQRVPARQVLRRRHRPPRARRPRAGRCGRRGRRLGAAARPRAGPRRCVRLGSDASRGARRAAPRARRPARRAGGGRRGGPAHAPRHLADARRHPPGVGVVLGVASGEVSADVVVGADGAHSFVRTALLGKRREPRAIAIRGYAPTTPEMAGRQVIRYGDRRQPSYAWAFDRGDGLANVGYGELLPGERHGGAPSRRLLLDQLELLVPGAASTGDDWRGHHLPLSSWRWDQPDGPVLLVGDAAGLVNPMTGEGIYYAVATGIAAGRTAARAVRAGQARGSRRGAPPRRTHAAGLPPAAHLDSLAAGAVAPHRRRRDPRCRSRPPRLRRPRRARPRRRPHRRPTGGRAAAQPRPSRPTHP